MKRLELSLADEEVEKEVEEEVEVEEESKKEGEEEEKEVVEQFERGEEKELEKEVEKEVVDNKGLAAHKECNSKIINESDLNKIGSSRKNYDKKEIKIKLIKRPPVKVNYLGIVMIFYILFKVSFKCHIDDKKFSFYFISCMCL